jgi:hypothetical protein
VEVRHQAAAKLHLSIWSRERRWCTLIAIPVDDSPPIEVIRGQLYAYSIAGSHANSEAPHPAGCIGDQPVLVLQLDLEHGVWQSHCDRAVEDDGLLLLDFSIRVAVPSNGTSGAASGRR